MLLESRASPKTHSIVDASAFHLNWRLLVSEAAVLMTWQELRRVIDRIDRDAESLRRARVHPAVGRSSIVFQSNAHSRCPVCVGYRGVAQRPVWADGWLFRKQAVVVVDQLERQRLLRLVSGPRADRCGPTVDNLEANIFIDGLAGPLGEAGRIVHNIHCNGESLQRAGVRSAVACASVILGDDSNMSYAV